MTGNNKVCQAPTGPGNELGKEKKRNLDHEAHRPLKKNPDRRRKISIPSLILSGEQNGCGLAVRDLSAHLSKLIKSVSIKQVKRGF